MTTKDNLGEDPTKETPKVDNSQAAEDKKAERRAQQEAWSKQEVDRLKSIAVDVAYKATKSDANSLLELHEKDPNLATIVAEKFGYDSFEEAKVLIESNAVVKDQWLSEDEFNKKYDARRTKEIHSDAIKKAESLIDKIEDKDQKEKAKANFDEIIEWKNLNYENSKRFVEMATLHVSKEDIKEWKFSDGLAQLWSIGIGKAKKWKVSEPKYILDSNWELVLDSNKLK